MWFATRDGLNRYDGNAFVVYKNKPSDPDSLSSNFIQALMEDDRGDLWIATNTGVDEFDPRTERFTRYLHDPNDSNTLGGVSIKSLAQDSRGYLWIGTEDSGLDRLDPKNGTFTHYPKDSDGHFVGRITMVVADRPARGSEPRADGQANIWFVGERGLFHLDPQTGRITRAPATIKGLSAECVYEDEAGNFWMLAPIIGLVKYDRQAERFTTYPVGARAVALANSALLADGHNGLWVPSKQGLYYFDLRTERFSFRLQHDDSHTDSLDSNNILSVYQDRGGVLWVGTENTGLNILNSQQDRFVRYVHRPADPKSVSPGRVKAIYEEPSGVLWLGFLPEALDRFDRKTGRIIHYVPKAGDDSTLCNGGQVVSIYKDAAGYLWVSVPGCGLDRFDQRTGHFKHYRPSHDDRDGKASNNVYGDVWKIYGDRNGQMWIGHRYGISRYDAATDAFTNYRPVPTDPESLENRVWVMYQDRSGPLWLGTWGGALIRFDDKKKTFVSYMPDPSDPHKLNGGGITTIHEDRTGMLWVGTFGGLYQFNRESGTFTRYTETQGLPSSTVRCILEDRVGRLWVSTQKGISRFDPRMGTFRNYDVFDGLQSNEFSDGCYQGSDGEMFFGGSNGFNTFYPDTIHDDPYVPPVVITSLRLFNKLVPVGSESVLKKAIPYVDSLTLSYRDNVFSFEFAALSYANSRKNRYRYKLKGFDPSWNEVDSKRRMATYTNLNPGRYVFRVTGSNSDGTWNEEGVSLSILITPPWWRTNWFRTLCAAVFLTLLWAAYQWRVQQLHHQFEQTLEARVGERTRIARDLHDTLLQSFQALLPRLQAGLNMLAARPGDARKVLEDAVDHASQAIAEGRDAVQGLRISTIEKNDLAAAIRLVGEELASAATSPTSPIFNVVVEGASRNLHPILRDEVYRLATEALRNAFRHAAAKKIEVEIRYDEKYFRLRVRDDGKGIPSDVLYGREGHYGLPGMRERGKLIGGKVTIWTELDGGTEIELNIPGARAYVDSTRPFWQFGKRSATETDEKEPIERE